jgi:hypothetical protein
MGRRGGSEPADASYLPIAKVGLRQMPPMPARSFYQACRFDGRGSFALVGQMSVARTEAFERSGKIVEQVLYDNHDKEGYQLLFKYSPGDTTGFGRT